MGGQQCQLVAIEYKTYINIIRTMYTCTRTLISLYYTVQEPYSVAGGITYLKFHKIQINIYVFQITKCDDAHLKISQYLYVIVLFWLDVPMNCKS